MNATILKITTTFQNTWLIQVKKDSFSEANQILYGDTLRLSITPQDTYYVATDIGLTYVKELLTIETPSDKEVAFFNYMSAIQEKAYSKTLAAEYDIEAYIKET
ncbi:hypothetical protein GIX45_10755 [Erwinia sp. CPCC 100877]|nr:hypothetical protein [Erwinia sp. CPCC 100877]